LWVLSIIILAMWVLAFLLVGVSVANADTIYGWYYGEELYKLLTTVNSYLSSSDFTMLWKVVVGLSAVFVLLAVATSFGDTRQAVRLLKFYVVVILVWYLGNVIKTDVNIEDRCTGKVWTNVEVPWAIGKAISYTTTLEKNIREGLVTFFGSFLPDSYKNHEGCFTGYELLRPALVYSPRNPYLRLSIRNYIKDCFVPNVLAGDVNRATLENSTDLWNDVLPCVAGQVCSALTTVYYSPTNPEGIVEGCPNAYARIDADMANEYTNAWGFIKAMVFGTGSSIADSDIPIYLGETSSYLMSTALTGENLIRQAISIQSINQVSAEFATAVAYQEAYLNALAKLNMLDFGRGGTLNTMKGVIQVMLIGLTPAFLVLFITPFGGRIFQGWITVLIWLIGWSVAEVIVVSMLYLYLGANYKFDFTLGDIDRVVFTFNKAAQISSMMSDWIPLIALFVVSGSIYSLTQFAKGLSGDLRDTHGAKVMASGNFDAGNVRVDNFTQATRALANSTVGVFGYNTVNMDTYTADELRHGNTTTNTETDGTFSKPMSLGGVRGFASGAKLEGGKQLIKEFSGNGITAGGWIKNSQGGLEATGQSWLRAVGGDNLRNFLLSTSSDFYMKVDNALRKAGIQYHEIERAEMTATEDGVMMTITKDDGSVWTVIAGKDGSTGTFQMGGIKGTVVDGNLVGISGVPVKANMEEVGREVATREQTLAKAIQNFEEKTKTWSDVSRAIYAQAINAFARGEISAQELDQTWQVLKEAEEGYSIDAKGSGRTRQNWDVSMGQKLLGKLPGRVRGIARRLPIFQTKITPEGRLSAGGSWGGRERKSAGSGGSVGETNAVGGSATTTDSYEDALNRTISEALRNARSELKSLRNTYAYMESAGISRSEDLNPYLISAYAKEKGIDYSEAVNELSANNWEGLKKLQERFMKDAGFRKNVIDEIKQRTEEATKGLENLNLEKAEGIPSVSGRVDKGIKEQKRDIGEKANSQTQQVAENIGKAREKGREVEGEVSDIFSDRETLAKVLGAMFFGTSLLGLGEVPPPVWKGGGLGRKGLPGGGHPELPGGGKGTPPAKPGGGPIEPRGYSQHDIERFKEEVRRYEENLRKMGATDEEIKRYRDLADRYIDALARGDTKAMQSINKEAGELLGNIFVRSGYVQKVEEAGKRIEKSLVKQMGETGAKSLLKKVPLVGLALAATFAYARAQEGDYTGAALELASGVASMIPGIGTAGSMAIDGYLMARDLGIVGDNVSRAEFNTMFTSALADRLQHVQFERTEQLSGVWNNQNLREEILSRMQSDPNYSLNVGGTQVRLDAEGNVYNFSALKEQGLSVNTEGQIYEIDTGRIRKDIDASRFVMGRVD